MKPNKIYELLKLVAAAYPTLDGLLDRRCGQSNLGSHWSKLLAELPDAADDHLANVCDEYIRLRRQLPERRDDLLFIIHEEVMERHYDDLEGLRLLEMRVGPQKGDLAKWTKDDRIGNIAVWLGEQRKRGHLSKEENDQRMNELLAYAQGDRGCPDWFPEDKREQKRDNEWLRRKYRRRREPETQAIFDADRKDLQ